MKKDEIEAALRGVYARRADNDPDGTMQIFAPDATYRIAGHEGFCGAVATHSGAALRPAIDFVCSIYHFKEFQVTSMIIDGDRASVVSRVTMIFTPTGDTVTTELAHFWTFKDGRATEVVEFLDTAYLAHLQAKRPAVQHAR